MDDSSPSSPTKPPPPLRPPAAPVPLTSLPPLASPRSSPYLSSYLCTFFLFSFLFFFSLIVLYFLFFFLRCFLLYFFLPLSSSSFSRSSRTFFLSLRHPAFLFLCCHHASPSRILFVILPYPKFHSLYLFSLYIFSFFLYVALVKPNINTTSDKKKRQCTSFYSRGKPQCRETSVENPIVRRCY